MSTDTGGPTLNNPVFASLSDKTMENYQNNAYLNSKYPLLILKPDFLKTDAKKQIDDECSRLKFSPKDIVNIKLTEAKNLLIYFDKPENYKRFLNLKNFLNGNIKELDQIQEEKCVIIRNTNSKELGEYKDTLDVHAITSIEDFKSRKQNVKLNMVKAQCSTLEAADLLCKEGIKFGYLTHKVIKFVKKPKVEICFNCGSPNHYAKYCKNQPKCIICSSTDHTKKECPHKADETRSNHKCPNCSGLHAATYGGCTKIKEKLKSLYVNKSTSYRDSLMRNKSSMPLINQSDPDSSNLKQAIETITSKISDINKSINNILPEFTEIKKQMEVLTDKVDKEMNSSKTLIQEMERSHSDTINKLIGLVSDTFLILNGNRKNELSQYKQKLGHYFNLTLDSSNKITKRLTQTNNDSKFNKQLSSSNINQINNE